MKKRLRKKKLKCSYKSVNVYIDSINCLEENFNYVITFKIMDKPCSKFKYQLQTLKYMSDYKNIPKMRKDMLEKKILKGRVCTKRMYPSLFICKYNLHLRNTTFQLGFSMSGKSYVMKNNS